jgi:chromosome segregation ATPase
MSDAAGKRRADMGSPEPSRAPDVPAVPALTPAEMLRQRAAAAGEEMAQALRRQARPEPVAAPADRKPDLAVLLPQVEELRTRADGLATRNAELERQLAKITIEAESLRAAEGDAGAELRRRIETLSEHLDAADRHVGSLRDRLDAQSADSARRIASLETKLAAREAELSGDVERLNAALAGETARLQQRIDELIAANDGLAAEARGAATAASRQRQGLETRIAALLADIDEMKTRHEEALADRDRTGADLRREIEKTQLAAGAEQAQLRHNLAESEAVRQRDAAQHASMVSALKATIASLEREGRSLRDAADIERRRLEGAIVDERDRARRLLEARDEVRRTIEARAEAAEKQAAGATAAATLGVARFQELERRLDGERTSRADEIAALEERIAALTSQLAATQNSNALVIDDLRLRLAATGDDGEAATFVEAAQERIGALTDELEMLRARLAERDASAAVEPMIDDGDTPLALADEPVAHEETVPATTDAAPLPAAPAVSSWRRPFGLGGRSSTPAIAGRRG